MKKTFRILCLLIALCLLLPGAAFSEAALPEPAVIVSCDRTLLLDWEPCYGLSMPGMLLEMTHAEAILSVTAIEKDSLTPERYLSDRLDRAGDMLSVSDAQLSLWPDVLDGDGRCLSFSYTYPGGDELHLTRSWAASYGDMLIDVTVDAWGTDAEALLAAAQGALIDGGFSLTVCRNASEITGTLSDIIEDENGAVSIQLTEAGMEFNRADPFYPLAENAVVLFPNPDDPLLLTPVEPDMASLVDAILAYEDSSDSPALFYTLIEGGQIIYMEFSLMQ